MKALVTTATIVLFISVIVRVEFGLAVLLLLGAVLALGFLVPRQVAAHLEVERSLPDRAFFGELVPVDLTIKNRSVLPALWVEVWELLPLAIAPAHASIKSVLAIPARDERKIHYQAHARRRGFWRIGPTTTATGDLLGVSVRRPTPHPAEYLIVYPKILPLARLGLPTRSPLAELPARLSLFSDPARVTGVRAYEQGDSLRRIHWTASAASGSLVVKQLERAVARQVMIYLDLNKRNYAPGKGISGTELAITIAASVAAHSVDRERQPVGLTCHGRDPLLGASTDITLPPEATRDHLMGVLEVLARFQTDPESDFAAMVRDGARHLSWGSTLLVVTGSVPQKLAETLTLLQRGGFAVAAILVQASGYGGSRLAEAGIRTYRVDTEQHVSVL